MIVDITLRSIPELLSHHTHFDSACSILGVLNEKDEICIRAVSNKTKNDPDEIKMGGYMHQKVCEYLNANGRKSTLQQFRGYEDSGSVSFTEGKSSVYMIENYGNIRLDFDLRNVSSIHKYFYECEYVDKNDIVDYTNEYISRFKSNWNNIVSAKNSSSNDSVWRFAINRIVMEEDIMAKVFSIKEKQWECEKEWRIIESLNENDTYILYNNEERPYKNVYISKSALKSVVVFCKVKNIPNGIRNFLAIRKIFREKGYSAKLKLRTYIKIPKKNY